MKNKILLLALVISLTLSGCTLQTNNSNIEINFKDIINKTIDIKDKENTTETKQDLNEAITESINKSTEENTAEQNGLIEIDSYRGIDVEGGDLSGHREPNVVVDIGFSDRKYYAFTNEYGQLFRVTAKEIIIQDDSTEPVLSTGRYYRDEAKVPGVESLTLDEGHVIADSLGGVSNAYNITPQESTLNRHGDQAYMERAIRDAGGCTDFVAIITYSDTTTQIPNHYSYTYTINGKIINDEFDNVNPDEVNSNLEEINQPKEIEKIPLDNKVMIKTLDKKAEYIIIKNSGDGAIDLNGWKIVSVRGNQTFIFTHYILNPSHTVKIGDSSKNSDVDFHWLDGRGTWNNSDSDPAELYNVLGELVDRMDD